MSFKTLILTSLDKQRIARLLQKNDADINWLISKIRLLEGSVRSAQRDIQSVETQLVEAKKKK